MSADDDLRISPTQDPLYYPTMFLRTWVAHNQPTIRFLEQPHSEKEKEKVRDKASAEIAKALALVFGEKYAVHWPKNKPIQINLKFSMGFDK